MPLLYDLATRLYHQGIKLAAPFHPKAKQWVDGRKGMWQRLEAAAPKLQGCLWMHCASVGEFEQGRPVLEEIVKERPGIPVLLTFFSPSGYEARKGFPLATHVEYLPPDGHANAQRLVGLVGPKAAVFIKYEFWYHHLHALKRADVPVFLVSALFRSGQPFFQWYGGAWRSMLKCYTHVFTQDQRSQELITSPGISRVTVSGDTRFDRVASIVEANEELPAARGFCDLRKGPVLVCGSTWPEDERIILDALTDMAQRPRIIIAPHELVGEGLDKLEAALPKPLITWSEASAAPNPSAISAMSTLLVDQMGFLARLPIRRYRIRGRRLYGWHTQHPGGRSLGPPSDLRAEAYQVHRGPRPDRRWGGLLCSQFG